MRWWLAPFFSSSTLTHTLATHPFLIRYDANISLPGCDKNMPGTIMAAARLDRPSLMIYGGTIKPGKDRVGEPLDIVSAFQSYGKRRRESVWAIHGRSFVKQARAFLNHSTRLPLSANNKPFGVAGGLRTGAPSAAPGHSFLISGRRWVLVPGPFSHRPRP